MRIPSFETDQWESNVEFGEGFYSSQRVFAPYATLSPFSVLRPIESELVDWRGDGEVVGAGVGHLGYCDVTRAEGSLAVAQVVTPFADKGFVKAQGADFWELGLESFRPAFESEGVVGGHVLVFEKVQVAAGCHGFCDAGVAHEEGAGEDVLLDEIHAVAEDGILIIRAEDRLKAEESLRLQEFIDFGEVAVHIAVADGFEHLDGCDFIEAATEVAVVAEQELDSLAESRFLNAARCFVVLLLGYGDGCDFTTVVFGCMHAEAAPTASDFQDAVGGEKAEAFAEFIVFPALGDFERFVGRFEIGTGIGHGVIKPELKEFVAEIVVLADVFPAHGAAIRSAQVEGAVDGIEQIEKTRATRLACLQSLCVVGVQDEPGNDLGEIVSRPFAGHVGFGKPDGTIENTPLEEVLISHLDAGLNPSSQSAVDAFGTIRKYDFEAAEFEFGEAIENESAEKHVSR